MCTGCSCMFVKQKSVLSESLLALTFTCGLNMLGTLWEVNGQRNNTKKSWFKIDDIRLNYNLIWNYWQFYAAIET